MTKLDVPSAKHSFGPLDFYAEKFTKNPLEPYLILLYTDSLRIYEENFLVGLNVGCAISCNIIVYTYRLSHVYSLFACWNQCIAA